MTSHGVADVSAVRVERRERAALRSDDVLVDGASQDVADDETEREDHRHHQHLQQQRGTR